MLALVLAGSLLRRPPPPPALVRVIDADGAERLWERFDTEREACAWARGQLSAGGFALVRTPGRWRCALVVAGEAPTDEALRGLSRRERLALALRARVTRCEAGGERALR